MILLVDRQKAKMFMLTNGTVANTVEIKDGHVPQKVKHGDDTWDAQNKIFRHIEDHLHRHLLLIGKKATDFARQNHVSGLIIGSHKALFSKVEKHLPVPLSKKLKGRFVTELKAPFNEILHKAVLCVAKIEKKKRKEHEA